MTVKILIVDDEPDLETLIRQKYRREIRKGDYEFIFATNGKDALEKLSDDESIDLIMTDINMPEMDGLTLLSRLDSVDLVLKPIIVSAYGDMQNIRKAMNLGAFDFVTKPINFDDLDITLKKSLAMVGKLKQINKLKEENERIQKEAIERILITIKHELNSPLMAVLVAAQKLHRTTQDDSASKYSDVIVKGAEAMDTVIKKLKELSQPLETEYTPGIKMIQLDADGDS